VTCYMIEYSRRSCDHRRQVYRPSGKCISGIQEIHGNSIEFSLLTQIRSSSKSAQLSSYRRSIVTCTCRGIVPTP